jgi:hypothetical protein
MDIKKEAFIIGFVKQAEVLKSSADKGILSNIGSYIYDAFAKPEGGWGHALTRAGIGAGGGYLAGQLLGIDPMKSMLAGGGLAAGAPWAAHQYKQWGVPFDIRKNPDLYKRWSSWNNPEAKNRLSAMRDIIGKNKADLRYFPDFTRRVMDNRNDPKGFSNYMMNLPQSYRTAWQQHVKGNK